MHYISKLVLIKNTHLKSLRNKLKDQREKSNQLKKYKNKSPDHIFFVVIYESVGKGEAKMRVWEMAMGLGFCGLCGTQLHKQS